MKNYTFDKSTLEFLSVGEFWNSTQTNCCHFAASNQYNIPDLLENMVVKLRSVYVRWG